MLPIHAFNHLLSSQSWARESLRIHSGKTARFFIAPFSFSFTVAPDGTVETAKKEAGLSISIAPSLLPRLLAKDETAFSYVTIEGDADFAKTVSHLFRNLKWDVEEDLSRVTGDILAHRIAGMAQGVFSWQKETLEKLLQNLAEYWLEESPLLAKKTPVAKFIDDVDSLRDDTARLGKRIEKLHSRNPL